MMVKGCNYRTAIVGWLGVEEARLCDSIAYKIAEQVCQNGAGSVDIQLIETYAKLKEKSEVNFLEWCNS